MLAYSFFILNITLVATPNIWLRSVWLKLCPNTAKMFDWARAFFLSKMFSLIRFCIWPGIQWVFIYNSDWHVTQKLGYAIVFMKTQIWYPMIAEYSFKIELKFCISCSGVSCCQHQCCIVIYSEVIDPSMKTCLCDCRWTLIGQRSTFLTSSVEFVWERRVWGFQRLIS